MSNKNSVFVLDANKNPSDPIHPAAARNEKFNRTCVYCGTKDATFNLDHFHSKSRGGSDKVSNLVLSCVECNQKKGSQLPADFLSKKPKLLALIEKQRKQPLADATAVNATRWKLKEVLESTGLSVEVGSGGLTKFNRKQLGISKSHCCLRWKIYSRNFEHSELSTIANQSYG